MAIFRQLRTDRPMRSLRSITGAGALRPIFDSGGSQFNREAAVAVGIVDPADDRWSVQFNRDIFSDSE